MQHAPPRRLAVCAAVLLAGACFLSACKTATPTWESSAEFRLQNVEAALLEVQDELKGLQERQSSDDKRWREASAKVDELLALVRGKAAAPGVPAATPGGAPAGAPVSATVPAVAPASPSPAVSAAGASPAPASPSATAAPGTLASLPRTGAASRRVPASAQSAAAQPAAAQDRKSVV